MADIVGELGNAIMAKRRDMLKRYNIEPERYEITVMLSYDFYREFRCEADQGVNFQIEESMMRTGSMQFCGATLAKSPDVERFKVLVDI